MSHAGAWEAPLLDLMCTISFLPHARGFHLAMNRDELLTRSPAIPPRVFTRGGTAALHPSEPGGGTWIGINEHAVCLGLVSWYSVRQPARRELVTRGSIIPLLLRSRSLDGVRHELGGMRLDDKAPFRLVALALGERQLSELQWDGRQLQEIREAWERRHWFSSGHDEARAGDERADACREACREPDAGGLPWLRRLHASHEPERGPLSICMHRSEAATVSYTEIVATRGRATMRYVPGTLCKELGRNATNLPAHYEHTTLELRPAGRASLSSRFSSGIADYLHAARGHGADESDL